MAPPSFSELGKAARDVLTKGYHIGLWKADCKSKTKTGISFVTAATYDQDKERAKGSLEVKYKVDDYGMSLTEKWDTDNLLTADFSIQDKLAQGLKLGLDGSFSPETGYKQLMLKAGYGTDNFKFDADYLFFLASPLLNCSVVFGHQGWLFGYQTGFSFDNMKLYKNILALGYTATDVAVHTTYDLKNEFKGEVYQRISDNLDCGLQVVWDGSGDDSDTRFSIGGTYNINADSVFRAKVNNNAQIGLGYQHLLREGVTIFLSTLINARNPGISNHRFGVGIEVQA